MAGLVFMEKKVKRYGKCNTIVIGKFAGRDNAFLIQNAFPAIKKYFVSKKIGNEFE